MKKLVLYLCILSFFSCKNDSDTVNTDDPTDLELDVLVYDNRSGIAVVNASASNAIEFQIDMGENGQDVITQASGSYEHQYKQSGDYVVSVRAYGESGRYIRKEKRIRVEAGGVVNIGQGYSTPLSYDGMDLVWNDEFNGTSLNLNDWSYENGTGCPNLCGWGNNELEYYRPENSWVRDGALVIEARKENYQGSEYTSTKIITRDKKNFQYGRVDIRAQLPKGQGIWPAFWMLGENFKTVGWPKCGEIDIMEMIGGNNRERTSHGNAFWDNNGVADFVGSYTLPNPTARLYDEFHVYSIIWDENQIQWFVDDNLFHTNNISTPDKTEFHKPFYFIMNVAVGGNWPGNPNQTTEFPTQMSVDYIRVFQKN